MGQANNRGPREARIEAAAQLKDPRIESLRALLGIPERVACGGYLVKVDRTDAFLGAVNDGEYAFVDAPERAVSFSAFDDARKLARTEQGEVVVAMFNFSAKVIVVNVPDEPDRDRPNH